MHGAAPSKSIFEADYIVINQSVLERISGALPFAVFVRRTLVDYTKIFPKGEPIDRERSLRYKQDKGVDQFYVERAEYRQYLLYVEQLAQKALSGETVVSHQQMTELLKEMVDLTMIEMVIDNQVDERSLAHAALTTQACMDILATDPKSLFHIFRMLAAHPYAMKHAMATSIFALLLAKQAGLTGEKTLSTLGLGALLHDLGMATLTFDAENTEQALLPEQWTELRRHPEMGKRLLDRVRLVPTEAKMIVLHHHEQPNGQGYPNGLRDRDIYYPSKIAAIADCFSALVTKRPYRAANSAHAALQIMHEDTGKFDRELLEKFKTIFVTLD